MDEDEIQDMIAKMDRCMRPYAPDFVNKQDKRITELTVARELRACLVQAGECFFDDPFPTPDGGDPPDCEAELYGGGQLGIEITELVDGKSIDAAAKGKSGSEAPLECAEILDHIQKIIDRKDTLATFDTGKYQRYMLIIHCADPRYLYYDAINAIRQTDFGDLHLTDVYVIMPSVTGEVHCRYFRINSRVGRRG